MRGACFLNSWWVKARSSLFAYFRKKSMVLGPPNQLSISKLETGTGISFCKRCWKQKPKSLKARQGSILNERADFLHFILIYPNYIRSLAGEVVGPFQYAFNDPKINIHSTSLLKSSEAALAPLGSLGFHTPNVQEDP